MDPITAMPNLPHFRANKPKLRGRGGDFQFTEGGAFFEQVRVCGPRCRLALFHRMPRLVSCIFMARTSRTHI